MSSLNTHWGKGQHDRPEQYRPSCAYDNGFLLRRRLRDWRWVRPIGAEYEVLRLTEMRQGETKILVRVVCTARQTLGLADCLLRHVEHVPHIDQVTQQHTVAQRCSRPDRECGG